MKWCQRDFNQLWEKKELGYWNRVLFAQGIKEHKLHGNGSKNNNEKYNWFATKKLNKKTNKKNVFTLKRKKYLGYLEVKKKPKTITSCRQRIGQKYELNLDGIKLVYIK